MKRLICLLLLSSQLDPITAAEPDELALNFHLIHPGELSAPGDPNAAFYLEGTYHLHYILRHNYNGEPSFSFVHVTSPDMLHWDWQPTKLQPSFTGHGMFSGTGFLTKEGMPAVIYHGQASDRNWIALAKDRDLSGWEKPYPVEVAGAPEGMRQWDPDCFLIGDTYYAISGGKNPPVFKSTDLKKWSYIGPFLSHEPADVVEGEDVSCANFFPIDDPSTGEQKWMLLCISHPHGCRYYLGDWDAKKEQFVPETHGRMNWPHEGQSPHRGRDSQMRDFFAPESVLTADARRVMWAWVSTPDPALRDKTIQSLPRELSLGEDGKLRIRPLRELESLRRDPLMIENVTVEPEELPFGGIGMKRLFDMGDNAWEIRVTVPRDQAEQKRFGLRLYTDEKNEGLPITIQPDNGTLRVGTTEAPFAVADLPPGEDVELTVFVDRYLIEVFVNERQAMVAAHVNGRSARGVDAYSWGAPITFEKVEIWRMQSTQQGYEEARENRNWQPEVGTAPVKPQVKQSRSKSAERRPPNFVIINVDDLGYADVQPFSDRFPTPHLARMAEEGRSFSSFYVASSVCTPSRAALMTGCHPARVDLLHNDLEMDTPNHGVLWPGDRKGLNPDEITLAEVLKARGYATACVGKWHLGDQPPFLPTRQGFDRYFGIPFSNDMGDVPPFHKPLPLVRDERVVEELKLADQDFLTKRYTEEALRFMEEKAEHPFFLYLPHSMVHGPLAASPAFRDKTGQGLFADAVAEVDWSVGQILDKLRELGIEEHTLVLFTSDNGGPYRPDREALGSSNFPFSGGKNTPAEGGFRVPTIAWWPGTIPAGTATDLMASTLDLLPTFAALSGAAHQPAADLPIDGFDLSGLFRGPLPSKSPRDSMIYYSDNLTKGEEKTPRRLTAVRLGKWKLYCQTVRFLKAGTSEMMTIPEGALFNLEVDPAETANVAAEFRGVRNRLQAFAEQVVAEFGERVGEGAEVRPAGFVEKADPLNAQASPERKDVLFIAIDDMNDWTTLFDPSNPIKTPNLERLATRGAFFTHAYCASPGCNPSRTAILTGLRPSTSGVYENQHAWRKALPGAVTLPKYFEQHGYATRGGGKIFHHGGSGAEDPANPSFQQFFKRVPTPFQEIRSEGSGTFDWGPVPAELMGDTPMIKWAEQELAKDHGAPLFLAAGIFHPHLPHYAPPEFFELYPFETVRQPPMPKNDLSDVPPIGIERAHCEHEWWSAYLFSDDPPADERLDSLKSLVRAYQASSSYADAMVGRLLNQLDASGRADDTIIVLWSDHGYHLGDKESVVKFTLWEKANHVPFIIVAPGVTKSGTRIDAPVGLANIYPTLADLAGLPPPSGIDGESLLPLLKDPGAEWERPALMTQGRGNHAIRSRDWRYIRYSDGTEELYDCQTDNPWNHTNLLTGDDAKKYTDVVAEHAKWLPKEEAADGSVNVRAGNTKDAR